MTRSAIPEGTRVGRTALRVADLAAMVDFYRDAVGLAVQTRTATSATLGAGGAPLLVLTESDAPARPPESAGLYHNAFRVPSRAALGDALHRIRERWTLDGASDHLVSEALYLTDPEGNGVEIYRDRPRAEWEVADDETVRIDTLPLDLEAVARDADGASAAPPDTTVGHVHLGASSLARAREFYVDALGLGVKHAYGDSALFVAAGDYHHHLGLNTWGGRSRPAEGRGRGLAWFELVVPDGDAMAAAERRLAAAGASPTDGDGGVEVVDPDGVAVRIRAGTAER